MAIDYGGKRCGIAVTDELRLSVNPREVIPPSDLLNFLVGFAKTEHLDCLVLTKSHHANGEPNKIQKAINSFAERVKEKLPELKIEFEDESQSSRQAMQHLIKSGVGKEKRKKKGSLDAISAGIILERYLRRKGIW